MLGAVGRRVMWLVLAFFAIVVVIALITGLPGKIDEARDQADNLDQVAQDLAGSRVSFEEAALGQAQEANQELADLRTASDAELYKAEQAIAARRRLAQSRVLDGSGVTRAALTGNSERIIESLKAQHVEVPLSNRALAFIELRQRNLEKSAVHRGQLGYLKAKIDNYNRNLDTYRERQSELDNLQQQAADERRNPLCRQVAVPLVCKKVLKIRELDKELEEEKQDLLQEREEIYALRTNLTRLQLVAETVPDATVVEQATTAFGNEASRIADASAGRVWNISRAALRKHGQQAFWILVAALLLPVLYKLFAFLVIAPLAARAPPVRILGATNPLLMENSHPYVDVPLNGDTELFVRSGVQSAASNISGRDVPVLEWRMLLTCVAAGLTNLQRLRSNGMDHVRLVAHHDQLAEVAIVSIPVGGAAVLQPRALVGVLKNRADRLHIKRAWRLGYLTSWLSFQLRYVIFHGPCCLIIRGRRGVAAEDAARGRMINRRLTLGFDAGLEYGVARSPTFLPYLRGEESLFNDRFSGRGSYLYEQYSATAKGRLWGRGLKGLRDAVLSAFGI